MRQIEKNVGFKRARVFHGQGAKPGVTYVAVRYQVITSGILAIVYSRMPKRVAKAVMDMDTVLHLYPN